MGRNTRKDKANQERLGPGFLPLCPVSNENNNSRVQLEKLGEKSNKIGVYIL